MEEESGFEASDAGVEAMQVKGVQGLLNQFSGDEEHGLVRFTSGLGIVGLKP